MRSTALPPPKVFISAAGRRIAYRDLGSGDRPLVLTHGLLMDARMYQRTAPALAERGNRVILADMLGHGSSDQPHDMTAYSMTQFGVDVVALLDHLGLAQAVIGGTSLGANVALEVAVAQPARVRALVVEMPVLEHGIAGAATAFVPLAFALRVVGPVMRCVASAARALPRSLFLVDTLLDFVRRDPDASLAVLDGITFGRVAPPVADRHRIPHPTLVIGHPNDPIHPFDDADILARELPRARMVMARSILEWRVAPRRLNGELAAFLDEVWTTPAVVEGAASPGPAA